MAIALAETSHGFETGWSTPSTRKAVASDDKPARNSAGSAARARMSRLRDSVRALSALLHLVKVSTAPTEPQPATSASVHICKLESAPAPVPGADVQAYKRAQRAQRWANGRMQLTQEFANLVTTDS
jgi:hypothetical protein